MTYPIPQSKIMEPERRNEESEKIGEKDLVVTQISVGGLEDHVTAKVLSDYFEEHIGDVWRCRLKTSSTPPNSDPNHEIDPETIQKSSDYEKVPPHAFLHFASSRSAEKALDAAGRLDLTLGNRSLIVSSGPENPHRMNERRRTTDPFKLSDVKLEIGVLRTKGDFLVGWRGPETGVNFLVDPFTGTCKILFDKETVFSFRDESKQAVVKCNYKVEFLPREINEIKSSKEISSLILLVELASSPLIFYRTADDDIEDSVPFDLLDDDDPWIRTTDFTPSGAIGRCNIYRIAIKPRNGPTLRKALEYLKNRRVTVLESGLERNFRVSNEPNFGAKMSEPFFCIQFKKDISFKVLFLLNAVMHKGVINQHQLSENFFNLLRSQPEDLNVLSLNHMWTKKRPVDNALEDLLNVQNWLLKNPKLLEKPREVDEIVEVRRLIITPTKAYCLPPEVELSNRVLRNYKEIGDRFLRITFTDEAMQTLNKNVLTYYASGIVRDITKNSNPQRTTMFFRVRNILTKGFNLCGRKYSFLAFSANQLRDRSAWFFAENEHTKVSTIKNWMGKFENRNVAKCAARMGQCFSSTYATAEVPSIQVNHDLADIQRNGYDFSDGIGKISADLAAEVAEKLHLSANPPSAYQIRYAGYKGVVACWPAKNDRFQLSLRPSMRKFESRHTVLEICSWTRFQPGFLNRQIITLLSALNVRDSVFWKMQENMVGSLDRMLENPDVAFDVVSGSCGDQGNTASIMLSAGFEPKTEPHLRGILTSIRAAQLGDLREKSRIFVPSGRWLMGCLDELGILEHGHCFIQVSNPSLEDSFVSHGSKFSGAKRNLQVVQGIVAIAKNPCLHPGDVRILKAVDVPELHHLSDCLIFPQKGERPHTNEASGSDLDGDLYFVTWDENLIPPSKRSWNPMDYNPGEVRLLPREVKHSDIIEFFTRNMVNESLGAICNAHVVHADRSEDGALDDKCIKLAELAATAVDFPKTGKIVTMPNDLKPKLYPDYMGKESFQSYNSSKILGRLYRQIRDAYGQESEKMTTFASEKIPYDKDLEIPGSNFFLSDAWNCKCSYDRQLIGLLGQYKVNKEEEVVSGHIWSMPKYSSKKQGELKERLKHAYTTLRKEFRKVFESMEKNPGFDELSDNEKNIEYEKKASAWYQVTYREDCVNKSKKLQFDDAGKAAMLSFAWIAADYLARIKIKRRRKENGISEHKAIDSLGRYLFNKI